MAPQARAKLPPELSCLTRKDMETVIYQANLGRENARIAQLYFVDKLPQVDVATELYLGRATVSCGRCSGHPTNCITEISAGFSALIFLYFCKKYLTYSV